MNAATPDPNLQLPFDPPFEPPPPTLPAAHPMVELRGVSKQFGSFTAVNAIDLEIRQGEFMTFLGPSGCGKTTLLRLISGFETASVGHIRIGGRDVTHVPPYQRDVNQVFQSYAIFPHLSVEDNVAFGLRMRRVPKAERAQRVDEALAMVSLRGMEKRRPQELSGGQRQRVALARAIVCRPKVLLLDEPLSALDAKLRHAMQFELKSLQRSLGITFIFVTHDQEEALIMSDRIAVMNHGRIEQLGNATEIYHEPATPFTADFIGDSNLLESSVVHRNGTLARVRLTEGVELTVRKNTLNETTSQALLSVRPEKIYITKTRPAKDNAFRGTIEEEVFRGAMDELRIRIGGTPGVAGLSLMAMVPNESSHERSWHKGDTVYCTIHTDDIVVVRQNA